MKRTYITPKAYIYSINIDKYLINVNTSETIDDDDSFGAKRRDNGSESLSADDIWGETQKNE